MRLDGQRIAISGIGGFIGARLAAMAAERGAEVVGLELDPAATSRVREAGHTVVEGSITDAAAVRRLVSGADAVIHTAALVREGGTLSEARLVNVGGTELVASEALRAGVELVLHLSSVMVYGFDFPDGVDEDGPLRGEDNPYCTTKIESELVARHFHSGQMAVSVVRPGDVYGAGCVPWVVRPLQMPKKMPLLLPSRTSIFNHLYVDNLASALLLMVKRRIGGQTLNLTDGGGIPFVDWFERLGSWQGRSVKVIDGRLMRAMLIAAERVARAAGQPFVEPDVVGFLSRPHRYGVARSQQVLGDDWKTVSFDLGASLTEAWARGVGLATEGAS
jgi:nucleoside-diphosphate-sugar epimerase